MALGTRFAFRCADFAGAQSMLALTGAILGIFMVRIRGPEATKSWMRKT